jgi:hypothetical protein
VTNRDYLIEPDRPEIKLGKIALGFDFGVLTVLTVCLPQAVKSGVFW